MQNGIVVYRNPVEQSLWEGVMNADPMCIVWGVGIAVFIGVAIVVWAKISESISNRNRRKGR